MQEIWCERIDSSQPELAAVIDEIAEECNIPRAVAKIAAARGCRNGMEAMAYLEPNVEDFHNPWDLPDMQKAVERILSAKENDEKVCVYGDYDVDGTTAVSILVDYFKSLGMDVMHKIPNRLIEGYGMNIEAVRKLIDCGVKLILLRCAGFNNVDLKAAKEYGMTVLRVPAYSPYAVAEHAMAILQAANRRLQRAYSRIRDNDFALSGLVGLDLHNKVAGIVGTGRIGQCFARICKGYGMTVIGWDAYPNRKLEDEGLLTYVTKEELFEKSDLISLHAPLIMGEGGTYHIIDEKAISRMKDDVMLVNAARGGLIDNNALLEALRAGKFHAVALDVYEGEEQNVYTDHSGDVITNDITARLQFYPQVVITSHQAFFTREALQAIATTTMENALNFSTGKPYGDAEVKLPD